MGLVSLDGVSCAATKKKCEYAHNKNTETQYSYISSVSLIELAPVYLLAPAYQILAQVLGHCAHSPAAAYSMHWASEDAADWMKSV